MSHHPPALPWLKPGAPFPPVQSAWGAEQPAPGLLAAGGSLDVSTLTSAYRQGIFPWFSEGQPILWWSTHPRMVLQTPDFRLHTSLRKQIRSLLKQQRLDIRMDHDFEAVIRSCANRPRPGQGGTWILPEMIQAYIRLHHQGLAHSVEAWIDGELAGGLYAVNLGRMVYGESMFSRSSNASKMALSALVGFCRQHRMPLIDCQQETAHLASMGAAPIDRKTFCAALEALVDAPSVHWRFDPLYWPRVLD